MQKDQWRLIAPLNFPRSGSALCSFQNKYIFSIGGRVNQNQIVDVIEVYDISRDVWQNLSTHLVDRTQWVAAYMGNAYQITENEILIFGGKSMLTEQIFNGCFLLDVERMTITEKGGMVNPCSFMNVPLVFNQNLYAYGNDTYIHLYHIPE